MALTITGLSKTYPNGVKALKNLSLTIGNNMFGLLGPNGAGKSTLMRTVATLQDPDEGSVTLDGIDVLKQKNEVRKVLGYLPQEFGVYPKMSASDMLDHLAILKGITSDERTQGNGRCAASANESLGRAQEISEHVFGRYEAALRDRAGPARESETDHRGRANRRPRSRRAQPLPELAQLHRPQRYRDPLHAYRRRRPRTLLRAWPSSLRAKCYTKVRPPRRSPRSREKSGAKSSETDDELRAIESQMNVISTHLVGGLHEIRVYADSNPGDGFKPVDSGLEDVYFLSLTRHARN